MELHGDGQAYLDMRKDVSPRGRPEKRLVLRHGNLSIDFGSNRSYVSYSNLPVDRMITTSDTGESLIQNLMLYLFENQAKTQEEFQECMKSVREFYSYYLMDKSALNMLACNLKLVRGEMP